LPPECGAWRNEREFAIKINKLAERMTSAVCAVYVDRSIIENNMDSDPRRTRMLILSDMQQVTIAALIDPINYYTADEIRRKADGLDPEDAGFQETAKGIIRGLSSQRPTDILLEASSFIGGIDLELKKTSDHFRATEDTLRKFYESDTAEVQVSLLMTYFTNTGLRPVARKYLMRWFPDCDVRSAQTAIGAYLYWGHAFLEENGLRTVVTEQDESGLERWKITAQKLKCICGSRPWKGWKCSDCGQTRLSVLTKG
jgi:hypothetical protein